MATATTTAGLDVWAHLAVGDPGLAADLKTRVEKGAALLDAARPGWAAAVALDRLAMGSCDDCVLGQVYGSYLGGRRKLGLPWMSEAANYGFTLSAWAARPARQIECVDCWPALGDLWRRAVRARLAREGVARG